MSRRKPRFPTECLSQAWRLTADRAKPDLPEYQRGRNVQLRRHVHPARQRFGQPQSYLFTLTAGDTAGNIVTTAIDPVTVERTSGAVAGRITFEGEVSTAPAQTVTFEFRPRSGDMSFVKFTRTASVKPDGFFNLDVPRHDYDLWIKGPKNLAKLVQANTLSSDAHNVTALLLAGDANNDNSCDTSDFGALVGSYGSSLNAPRKRLRSRRRLQRRRLRRHHRLRTPRRKLRKRGRQLKENRKQKTEANVGV